MSNIITVAKQQPTIVMVPAKAVKQDLKTETNTIVYMPLASRVTPGVVQIGDGLNIDINGILSFDESKVTILQIAKNGEIIHPDENKIVNIVLNKNDVGLGNVDNTADINKPVSIYQQEALNAKQNKYVGVENAGKMAYVDDAGNIAFRQMLHQFVTKNDGVVISKDTLAYNYSPLFTVTTQDGTEISIDGSAELKDSFKNVTYDAATGVLKFVRLNGSELNVDLPLELLIKAGYYDNSTSELVLVLANDEEIRIPVADLVNTYYADNTTLELSNINGNLTFSVKNGGITTDKIANYTVTDDKIVTVSGSKITGVVAESIMATQDENGNNISTTYRKMTDSYSRTETDELLTNKADVSLLPRIVRLGGF